MPLRFRCCSEKHGRLARRLLFWGLAGFCVWLVVLGTAIWNFGARDRAVPSDCIIVLGAAVNRKEPSPVFAERLRHGVSLYQNRTAPRILLTGGFTPGGTVSESAAGAEFVLKSGVPASALLKEEKSRTTQQNLTEASAIMRREGLRSAVIVSDPLHLKRALRMAEDLGMEAVPSPTPTSRYRSLSTRSLFLLREIYLFHHYIFTGD